MGPAQWGREAAGPTDGGLGQADGIVPNKEERFCRLECYLPFLSVEGHGGEYAQVCQVEEEVNQE